MLANETACKKGKVHILRKNAKSNMKKIGIVGSVVCLAFNISCFEVAASDQEENIVEEELQNNDKLQKVFLSIDKDTTEDEVLDLITEYGLESTVEEYNGRPKSRNYSIAFEADVALQKYAESGDSLEVSFDKNNGSILYAEYFNEESFKNAIYYNYGTYWDFREDEPDNAYSGYYYHKPGDTKGGITIKYSNGNSKETGYYSVDSAELALSYISSLNT